MNPQLASQESYPMFWHPIFLERCSLLDHCGSPGKPESSGYVIYTIQPSIHLPTQHPLVHSLGIYLYTHSTILNPSTHSIPIYLSMKHPSVHPPIQHPCIHHPFNIYPSTHSTAISHPHVYAFSNSPKPIHSSDSYLLIIHHSM